ncbi:MAG: hypothetical protein RRA32_03555 [bacterium]|nr:hypothetical protein [bacterium]
MARRKREIKKRKKTQEQLLQPGGSVFEKEDTVAEPAGQVIASFHDAPGEPEFDDSTAVAPSSPPLAEKVGGKARREEPPPAKRVPDSSWLGRNKENLLLGMLVLYVFLLGLGTVGELFEIEWILNLPLFR